MSRGKLYFATACERPPTRFCERHTVDDASVMDSMVVNQSNLLINGMVMFFVFENFKMLSNVPHINTDWSSAC